MQFSWENGKSCQSHDKDKYAAWFSANNQTHPTSSEAVRPKYPNQTQIKEETLHLT